MPDLKSKYCIAEYCSAKHSSAKYNSAKHSSTKYSRTFSVGANQRSTNHSNFHRCTNTNNCITINFGTR